jgi:hypothetical protein
MNLTYRQLILLTTAITVFYDENPQFNAGLARELIEMLVETTAE